MVLCSYCQKTIFYTFVKMRKGLGNEACPKFNPQSEFISDEEKREFQGFKPMGLLLYTSVYSSKA